MSLVVGLVENGLTYLIGDTAITFGGQRTNPYVLGCLKQYIVTPDIAIGFAANSIDDFEKIATQIFSCQNADSITRTVLEAQNNGLDFDLLVAEKDSQFIRKLSGGTIEREHFTYVGDQGAFEELRNRISRPKQITGNPGRGSLSGIRLPEPVIQNSNYARLFDAIREIIENPEFPTVGGVIYPIATDKGRFQAMNYFSATSDILDESKFNGQPFKMDFGTAEGGGFTVDFGGQDDEGDPNAVGLYFLQGKMGLCFLANANGLREAVIVRADNAPLWHRETQRLLGKPLLSGFTGPDACGIAGEDMLAQERYEDSIYCYELGLEAAKFSENPATRDRYVAGYATAIFNTGNFAKAIEIVEREIFNAPSSKGCKAQLAKFFKAQSSLGV